MDARPDLMDVVEHYTQNRSARKVISCPLHEDQNPSCSVDYDKGLWNCHSCGRGGSSWDMIMLAEDCDFRTATMLAQKFDLKLIDEEGVQHGNRYTGRTTVVRRKRDGKRDHYRPRFARQREAGD